VNYIFFLFLSDGEMKKNAEDTKKFIFTNKAFGQGAREHEIASFYGAFQFSAARNLIGKREKVAS
jgi:hypothetical protein